MKNRGKGARFNCNHGFELDGQKNILCQMGRWDEDVPVCTSNFNCSELNIEPICSHSLN